MKLIFIHGREQETFEADYLKQLWTDTLKEGLKKNDLTLPDNVTIEFPYFGKLLKSMADNPDAIPIEKVTTRSFKKSISENAFMYAYLNEVLARADPSAKGKATRDGLLNNETIQKLLQKIDNIGFLGEFSLKKMTKDVYLYLTHSGIKKRINECVLAIMDNEPCVVVGHSLGSIVSYDVLKNNSTLHVNKLITVGSPLGIASVRKNLPQPIGMPSCVKNGWFNAYDDADFVALNPLDAAYFPIDPTIVNKNDVKNHTDNRHGIIGYLNDAVVAKTIYEALMSK
jgi:hypothetical protein